MMFERLFRTRRPPVGFTPTETLPRPPDGTRLYVIGDIHGRLDLLTDLHRRMLADASQSTARPVVVYLGDYIDRGPDSKGVIELLVADPLPGFDRVFVKGNHEQTLLEFLDAGDVGPVWLDVGGASTFLSYGVKPPTWGADGDAIDAARIALAAAIPPSHHAFYRSLRPYHVAGDYLMVHAGIRPGIALEDQLERDLLWIREPFLSDQGGFERFVVHGHTITREPDRRANRLGIDTGAYHSGRLTCFIAEGAATGFIQTGGQAIPPG